MSKYAPLTHFLAAKNGREVRMTFAEIEQVIGHRLPVKSKAIRAWWSNNPSNNVLTRAWLAAGYKSAQVDIAGEKLTFLPDSTRGFAELKQVIFQKESPAKPASKAKAAKEKAHHPAFGIWKGLVTLDPEYDYTQPADPEWGKVYDD